MSKHKKNWGKEIKDVGVLFIIVGAVMFGLVVLAMGSGGSGSNQSLLSHFVDMYIEFFLIGGALILLLGIIIRSIGKSKEMKSIEDKKD